VPRTVLIVSSGRTGTRFLARYFDGNFADVEARHEPWPRLSLRLASNAYAAGAFSGAALLAMLRRRKRRRIDRSGARIYIESNPLLWGAIDLFDEAFFDEATGEPTIVHVVRDPREQARSSLNHGTSTGSKGIANRWLPYWHPGVTSLAARRGASDWLARTAALWAVVNQRLHDEGARCHDYQLIRYEDLFDESHSGLRRLCDLLGLVYRGAGAQVDPSRRINRGRRDAFPGWQSWSEEQCATLQRSCGPLMRTYGYGTEPEWSCRVAHVDAGRGGS